MRESAVDWSSRCMQLDLLGVGAEVAQLLSNVKPAALERAPDV